MAAIARSHGDHRRGGHLRGVGPAAADCSTWSMSGQAWHWVEPGRESRKRPRSCNPAVTSRCSGIAAGIDPEIAAALDAVYERLAPSIEQADDRAAPARIEAHDERFEALENSGRFTDVEARAYPWETVVRPRRVARLHRHAQRSRARSPTRSAAHSSTPSAMSSTGFGGTIAYHFSTLLLTATRDGLTTAVPSLAMATAAEPRRIALSHVAEEARALGMRLLSRR